jgi:hypothetical protein
VLCVSRFAILNCVFAADSLQVRYVEILQASSSLGFARDKSDALRMTSRMAAFR